MMVFSSLTLTFDLPVEGGSREKLHPYGINSMIITVLLLCFFISCVTIIISHNYINSDLNILKTKTNA